MTGLRALRIGLTAVFLAVAALAWGGPTGSPEASATPEPPAAAAAESSALTKPGTGRFADLDVTVSQTQGLRNQVVTVSWTGGDESGEGAGRFASNYLQIMQCWGDGDAPDRSHCQYGGLWQDTRGGAYTSTRTLGNDGQLLDPAETLTPAFGREVEVPFESVDGTVVTTKRNQFFDAYSTNEIPYGRTSADGSGVEFFEVQTIREAPGLGCGARLSRGARDCWLVVVPRDTTEVDGSDITRFPVPSLETSPLSASNFANAISFRLGFEPVGLSCPIGSAERRLLGNENAAEAVTRWQPSLCDVTGSVFGFSQVGDDLARNQTLSDTPWLSMVDRPVDPDVAGDADLVYAPLTISAVGIAVVIERVPDLEAPPEVVARRGTRVLDLKLNPRLLAKLLTQSYRSAVPGLSDYLGDNPRTLIDDPEFIALNPEFESLGYPSKLFAVTNPLGLSDANRAVWEWIGSDKDASAFLEGDPDPWGTKVNKYYRDISTDRADFPRSDPTCTSFPNSPTDQADLCPLDWLAYAADFHAAGRAAARGQTLANSTWDASTSPGRYRADAPQRNGERAVLALVDTATAARYQLPLARLLNGAGEYVGPNADGMAEAVEGAVETEVAGVVAIDPETNQPGAYPLTTVTYGVTNPARLQRDEAKDYAGFLRYATGKGQTPGVAAGTLPDGYLPLPATMRRQGAAAATQVIEGARGTDVPTPTEPIPSTTPSTPDPTTPDSPDGEPTIPDSGPGVGGFDTPTVPAPGRGEKPPTGDQVPLTDTPTVPTAAPVATPSTPIGWQRYLMLAALVAAALTGLGPAVFKQLRRGAPPT